MGADGCLGWDTKGTGLVEVTCVLWPSPHRDAAGQCLLAGKLLLPSP